MQPPEPADPRAESRRRQRQAEQAGAAPPPPPPPPGAPPPGAQRSPTGRPLSGGLSGSSGDARRPAPAPQGGAWATGASQGSGAFGPGMLVSPPPGVVSDAIASSGVRARTPGDTTQRLPPGQEPLSASGSARRPVTSPQDPGPPLQASGQDARANAGWSGEQPRAGGGEPPSPGSSLVGRRVGPYRITALIAQGGMGAVYEAVHERLDRSVALKTLLAGPDAPREDVQRFLNEARAAARLSHKNLVPIHDVGEHQGVRYLAMELVRGETLHGLIRRAGPLDERRALDIIAQVADGLEHAHSLGVLHRDMKPANVLLGQDGVPRITDFGVAKASGNQSLTATGTALGTPSYMSPEQAMGRNPELDARTDVYGLGAVLYECLTGSPPFDHGTHLLTMQAVVNDRPVPPGELRKGLDRDVEAICLKCIEKRPEDRYASARALADEARRWSQGDGVAARPAGRVALAARRLGRHVPLLAGVAVTLAALIALGLGIALPALREREAADAQVAAARALRARVDALRAELDGPRPEPARLASILGELDLARLRQAHGVVDGPPPAVAAGGRGLEARAEVEAELARLRARAHALRGRGQDGEVIDRGALVLAALEAPDGPAGRAARLDLARALVAGSDAAVVAAAQVELEALAAGDDEAATLASAELAALLAAQGRYAEALGHGARAAARPDLGAGERRRLEVIAALGAVVPPALNLPEHDHALAVRGGRGAVALVLTRGADIWAQPLEPARAPGPDALTLGRPEASVRRPNGTSGYQHVLAGDRDGDGRDELFLLSREGPIALAYPERPANDWIVPLASFTRVREYRDAAVGDVDGDRRADLVIVIHEEGDVSCCLLGRGDGSQSVGLFRPGTPRRYALERVACVDLDGDGRDEVITGGSTFDPVLEVLAWEPTTSTFASRARLPAGPITALQPYELEAGRRGVLAVVDARRDDRATPRAAGDPAWRGRDGVLLVEQTTGGPAIVGRWTWGPDEAPDATSRGATEGVFGFALPGETPLLVRGAQVDQAWRVEVVQRARVALVEPVAPDLVLPGAGPPEGRPLVTDLDQDAAKDVELVLGGQVLGAGAAPPPVAPAARGEVQPTRAAALLAAVRAATALGDEPLARDLTARLLALEGGGLEARQAEAAPAEAALRRGEAASREASAAFGRLALEPGRAAWRRALDEWARAAQSFEVLARERPPAAERWSRAAWAWTRAEQPARAVKALEALLAERGLAPDVAARARDELEALRRELGVGALDVDLTTAEGRRDLLASAPLRVRTDPRGISVRCAPDCEDYALVPVNLYRLVPGAVDVTLHTEGAAWASRVEAGLFEDDGDDGGPGRFTGVQLELWDVRTRQLGLRGVVRGTPMGALLRLPSFVTSLHVRLELRPAPAGVRAVVRVLDPQGGLVWAHDAVVDAGSPGGDCFVGLRSPRHGNVDEACCEQPTWAMQTRAVLSRVRVEGQRPARRDGAPDATTHAHGAFALGDLAAARTGYDANLHIDEAAGVQVIDPQALFFRGLARGRLQDPDAARDLVAAARAAPWEAVRWFEDLAVELPDAAPTDLMTIGAALRALEQDADPLLSAMGRQLQGDVDALPPPATADTDDERRAAISYLAMRAVHDASRWSTYPAYRLQHPEDRLPRRSLPQVLDIPPAPLDDVAAQSLIREVQAQACLHRRFALVARLVASRNAELDGQLLLASTLHQSGFLGDAQAVLRRFIARQTRPDRLQTAWLLMASIESALGDAAGLQAALDAARERAVDPAKVDEIGQVLRERLGRIDPPTLQEGRR